MDAGKERKAAGLLLKDKRKSAGFTQPQLAERIRARLGKEISEDVVSNIERGITPMTRQMRSIIAEILSCNEDDLKPWKDSEQSSITGADDLPATARKHSNLGTSVPVARAGWVHVPIYGALPAGAPGYTLSDVIEWEVMPEWSNTFDRWGRVVLGDSMNDEFEDGDVAIFENRRAEDGHGVHAFSEGEETFKIYRVVGSGAELWPTNPDPRFSAFSAENWDIRGVCIQRIRKGPHGIKDTREYPHGYRFRFR